MRPECILSDPAAVQTPRVCVCSISQQKAIVALDNRTKQAPLYRGDDDRFKKSLTDSVRISDKIGYIYWFFVLITISCGGATGVFVTYKNRVAMERVCADKLDFYAANYGGQLVGLPTLPADVDHEHVAVIEEHLM